MHLWRLSGVAGKLNPTPKSLNSTGKRELLEILRIWILQDHEYRFSIDLVGVKHGETIAILVLVGTDLVSRPT